MNHVWYSFEILFRKRSRLQRIAWKCMERNILYYGNRYCIVTRKKYIKQAKNIKSFLFKAVIQPILVTANFLKQNCIKWTFKFGIRISWDYSYVGMQNLWYIPGMYTAGSTKGLYSFMRTYSTYFLHIFQRECYQHNYKKLM